jgi:hypothetical protein
MKTMLRIAFAALSVASISPAFADGDGGPAANFSTFPTEMIQAQAQEAPRASVATAQNGQAVTTYMTTSSGVTSLYPPAQNGNG